MKTISLPTVLFLMTAVAIFFSVIGLSHGIPFDAGAGIAY